MADVRSLLRSHQQSSAATRISHPLASYNAAGALRCTACSIVVKPSAWEGHVVSKAHRKRAAVLKMDSAERKGKRKDLADVEEDADLTKETKKRRVSEDVDMDDSQPAPNANGGFPAGFFSDPQRAPPPPRDDSPSPSADMDTVTAAAPTSQAAPSTTTAPPAPALSALDLEWESFKAAVLDAPPPGTNGDSYAAATVFAEEEIFAPTLPEGFPAELQSVVDAQQPAQPKRQPQRNVQTATGENPTDKEETEEEKRGRKAQEEKELIMDRILDEERAQEEADERVTALKNRLEAMKKMRRERTGKKGA